MGLFLHSLFILPLFPGRAQTFHDSGPGEWVDDNEDYDMMRMLLLLLLTMMTTTTTTTTTMMMMMMMMVMMIS